MANGTAANGQCFATQAEAAIAYCSSVGGSSAAGVHGCVGSAAGDGSFGSGSSGGFFSFSYYLATTPASGEVSYRTATASLMPCETYGLDYWQPAIAAWVLAAAGIVAAKMVYRRVFGDRSTY